jgi:ketosteroid isomerase-like protein
MFTMDSSTTLAVARKYADAVAAKDFGAVAALFTEDVVWHQPGNHRLAGAHVGGDAVNRMLGAQMAATNGTLEITPTGPTMVNGALFTIPVRFSARRDGAVMSMDGVDVFRVEDDRIAEVWLFSADQDAEDAFWDAN